MIDLHSHILPGIDDGAGTLETSLTMARLAVDDGTTVMACTPHIYPGLYMNDSNGIEAHCDRFRAALDEANIPLRLVTGADAHMVPDLLEGLVAGRVPTLNRSRYFLLEPSHHVAPPMMEETVFQIMAAGFVPVLTHPERLVWIEDNYPTFVTLARRGVWIQLTAGAVVGKFGKRARYWSEKFLADGLVHVIASDAHTTHMRSPRMSDARTAIASAVGAEEARRILVERPQAVLDNTAPEQTALVPGLSAGNEPADKKPWLRRLFSRN